MQDAVIVDAAEQVTLDERHLRPAFASLTGRNRPPWLVPITIAS